MLCESTVLHGLGVLRTDAHSLLVMDVVTSRSTFAWYFLERGDTARLPTLGHLQGLNVGFASVYLAYEHPLGHLPLIA